MLSQRIGRLRLAIHPDIVDHHLLWKGRRSVGIAWPTSAHGEVEQQKEWMIEDPFSPGRQIGRRHTMIPAAVDVPENLLRLPGNNENMEVVRVDSVWQCVGSTNAAGA